MKLKVILSTIVIGTLLSGCTSSKISELNDRVSRLEKVPPSLDATTQRVLDILIGGPGSSNDQPSQLEAAMALALFKRTETTAEIIKQAQATQNQHYRMKCHNALGLMGDPQAIPYLKIAINNDGYEYSRRSAAIALEALTGEKYLTNEYGFESKGERLERVKREAKEKLQKQKNNANQKLQPTVKTPVEAGKVQGTAAEL
jgi:hypothetical protein